jgi:hypothetical protein
MQLPAAGWVLLGGVSEWWCHQARTANIDNSQQTAKFSCANRHKTCVLSQKCAAADDQCIDRFSAERIQAGQTLAASPGNVGRNRRAEQILL